MNSEFWATLSWLILHHCSPFTESECRQLQYNLPIAIHWVGVINRKFLSAAQVHILHLSCRAYRYLATWCRYQLLQKCRMFWSQVLAASFCTPWEYSVHFQWRDLIDVRTGLYVIAKILSNSCHCMRLSVRLPLPGMAQVWWYCLKRNCTLLISNSRPLLRYEF
jgi:hypothetical protein